MMRTPDPDITVWQNGHDVFDISEDEDTQMYSMPPAPAMQSSLNNAKMTVNKVAQPTMLEPQAPPASQQQAFSPKPATTAKTNPNKTDEDDDVIEIVKEIEVIVIDDDGDEPENGTKENEERATTEPNSQPKTQETQPYFWDYRNTFVLPAESSLLTPPTTPSSDIKDLSYLKLKSEEIALNLKAQETLSSVPVAMAIIPSPERNEEYIDEEPWASLFESSTLELTPRRSIEETPSNLQSSSVTSTNHNSSTSSLLARPVEDPLEGPSSLLDNNENDSCSTLILSPLDLVEDAAASLTHVSTNTPSKLELLSVFPTEDILRNILSETSFHSVDPSALPSAHSTAVMSKNIEMPLTFSTTTSQSVKLVQAHVSHYAPPINEPSATLDKSPMPSEKLLRTPQSLFFPKLSTDNLSSIIPSLKDLPPNKSIFDCPEIYRACYEKCSPQIQKYWDKFSLHREKIMNVLNKYSNENVIKPKTVKKSATFDVTNAEIGKTIVHNSTANDRREKSDMDGLNNIRKEQKQRSKQKNRKEKRGKPMTEMKKYLTKCGKEIKKVGHEKSQNGLARNDKCEVTVDSPNLRNSCDIDSEKNVHPNMPMQPNILVTTKQSCSLKNVSQREKANEKLNVDAKTKKIRSEDTNSSKSQQRTGKSVRKRSSSGTSSNQTVNDIIHINDSSPPKCKKLKFDNYSSKVDAAQNNTIVSNTNRTDIVSEICGLMDQERLKKHQKSSKENDQNDLTIINITQKPAKSTKKYEQIKTNAKVYTTFNRNAEYARDLLPSTSKQYDERSKNKTKSNTKPDRVENKYKKQAESKLKLTIIKERSSNGIRRYYDSRTFDQNVERARDRNKKVELNQTNATASSSSSYSVKRARNLNKTDEKNKTKETASTSFNLNVDYAPDRNKEGQIYLNNTETLQLLRNLNQSLDHLPNLQASTSLQFIHRPAFNLRRVSSIPVLPFNVQAINNTLGSLNRIDRTRNPFVTRVLPRITVPPQSYHNRIPPTAHLRVNNGQPNETRQHNATHLFMRPLHPRPDYI